MAADMTAAQARRLYDMGLISEDEHQHYLRLAEWRNTLRAGANSHTSGPLRSCGGTSGNRSDAHH